MATKALKAEDHPAPEETGHTEKKPARGKRKSQRLREVQTSKTLDDDDIGEPGKRISLLSPLRRKRPALRVDC